MDQKVQDPRPPLENRIFESRSYLAKFWFTMLNKIGRIVSMKPPRLFGSAVTG